MKTSLVYRNLFKPWKNFVETGSSGSYLPPSSSGPRSRLGFPAQTILKSQVTRRAFVNRVVAFLASTKALVKSATLNNRIYLAFILFCASPFAATIHMPFNRDVIYPWMGFIENWFHLLNLIGPYLFCLVVLSGVCLLIPPKQKTFKVFKWSLSVQLSRMMAIPIGFSIGKIIWLCSIDSNEDFWTIPDWSYSVAGLSFGYIFYRSIEYLTWRKYHAFDGLIATLKGAMNLYLPAEIRSKMEPLIQDLEQFNVKY